MTPLNRRLLAVAIATNLITSAVIQDGLSSKRTRRAEEAALKNYVALEPGMPLTEAEGLLGAVRATPAHPTDTRVTDHWTGHVSVWATWPNAQRTYPGGGRYQITILPTKDGLTVEAKMLVRRERHSLRRLVYEGRLLWGRLRWW